MAKTHYQVLGIKLTSSADEIRSAYRKLAMQHHPDRSKDPRSTELFIEITQAYNVLSDPDSRASYDRSIAPKAPPKPPAQPKPAPPRTDSVRTAVAADVLRLSSIFGRGQHREAETLARRIISQDPKQPVPYAVLGDLARAKGNLGEAAKMYAYAAQMDPRNPIYQRRHEELIDSTEVLLGSDSQKGITALYVAAGLVLVTGIYLALSKETAVMPAFPLISSFTLGLLVMSFISGVSIGACLAIGNWVDRFGNASATANRIPQHVALATVAVVNFWVAACLYALLGSVNRSFNVSTSRLLTGVAAGVVILALCAAVSPSLNWRQTFLWSGNVVYVGSLSGWMIADGFRRAA